ncbi:MAG: hypothetical protein F4X08_01795 [Gemmatimonadetes bacterium]|nr:hypothetical protein [Gemmatimonadota bacterium]
MSEDYGRVCTISGMEEVGRRLAELSGIQKRLHEGAAATLKKAKELATCKEESANRRRQIRKVEAQIKAA